MERLTASNVFISLVCILVLTVAFKVVNWVWLRPKKLEKWLRQQGLPGTSYRVLFGDVKDYVSTRSQATKNAMEGFSNDFTHRVEPLHHQLMSRFGGVKAGKCYFIWFGPKPLLNILRPELVKEALTKMHVFQKPRFNPIFDELFPGFVNYEGEKWAKHRKMITPAFTMEKLKLMVPAFLDSCADMVNEWENVLAETGSSELDVWPYLKTLTADVISRAAFGSSYTEGQKLFQLLSEQTDIVVQMLKSIYIPGMRYIPTARNRRFKELEVNIRILLKGIVNKRKEEIKAGEEIKADLLGILLDSNTNETQQGFGNKNKKFGLSLQEVIDECKLFYLGGQETTSVLLVWTLILLSKHQDWQTRAREEVLQTFGDKAPDFDGLLHLKTVTMILYEVLRLYSPASQLFRRVSKDTKLGDLSLPAGAMVNFSIMLIHRDKDFWGDDAEEFRPDRFSEGISKATRGNHIFFPFGSGPRICIGERFAMTEAKMALSMILQRFALELSPSYAHAPTTVIFLQPQQGAQLILRKL